MITEKYDETKVYNSIIQYIQTHGYSPSIRDLCKINEIKSSSTVWEILQELERQGKIRAGKKNSPRTIAVVGYRFCKETRGGKR